MYTMNKPVLGAKLVEGMRLFLPFLVFHSNLEGVKGNKNASQVTFRIYAR